ncbi:DoxX family protein [Streptomyces sp. NPDC046805]|uniref:DoxX family protein n=1 Tax=Streptomyces sp. NPDC046805 TaxID=3155134 RepID=UPI00340A5C6B
MSAGAGTPGSSLHAYDVGLLILRIALGLILAVHGTQKLFGWFGSGGGLDSTAQFFTMSGYPAARVMAVIAGLTETLGGLGLVLGLLTPLAGAAALGTMINAVAVTSAGGFFAPNGVEYPLVLAAGAGALALTGPGRLAVDRFLPVLRAHRLAYGVAALVIAAVMSALVLTARH